MMEVWKDIPNYEGHYQVSNLGNVMSLKFNNGKVLTPILMNQGYLCVNLSKENVKEVKIIHHLVAELFLGHKPDGTRKIVVDHINNIKTDNRLVNLQLTTIRHNNSKDKKGGTSKYTGVCWDKTRNKWLARIKTNGNQKHLGYFRCELAASQAYQNELLFLKHKI